MDQSLSCQESLKLPRTLSLTAVFIAIMMVCPIFGKPMVKPLLIGFIVQQRNNTAANRTTGIPGLETSKSLPAKMSPPSPATSPTSNVLPNSKSKGQKTQVYFAHKQNWTQMWPTKTNSTVGSNVGIMPPEFPIPNSTISSSKKDNKKSENLNGNSKERKTIPDNISPLHSSSSLFPTPHERDLSQTHDQNPHHHLPPSDSNLPYTTPKILPVKSPKKLPSKGDKNSTISVSKKTSKPMFSKTTIEHFSFYTSEPLKVTPTSKVSLAPSKTVGIPTKPIISENPLSFPPSTVKHLLSTKCAKCTTTVSKILPSQTGSQEQMLQSTSTVATKSMDHIKRKTLKPIKILPSSSSNKISSEIPTTQSPFSSSTKSIEKQKRITKKPSMKSSPLTFSSSEVTSRHWSSPAPTKPSISTAETKTFLPQTSTFIPSPLSSLSPMLSSSFTKSTTNHSAVPERSTAVPPETRRTLTVAATTTAITTTTKSINTSTSSSMIKLKTPSLPRSTTTMTPIKTTYPTKTASEPPSTKSISMVTKTDVTTTPSSTTSHPTTKSTITNSPSARHKKTTPWILSTMGVLITTRQTPAILPLHITVHLKMTWYDFCQLRSDFVRDLARFLKEGLQTDVGSDQIILLSPEVVECETDRLNQDQRPAIDIKLYLSNIEGVYNPELTRNGFNFIAQGLKTDARSPFHNWLDKVYLVPGQSRVGNVSPSTDSQKVDTGVAIAIALATIGGLCCLALLVLQIIVHRRRCQKLHMYMPSRKLSLTSLDSIALANMSRSRPCSGLYNAGMDPSDHAELSHPLDYQGLKNMCSDVERIYEEFQLLPNTTPKHSDLPMGVEEKNRFIDVLPTPETRVKLKTIPGEENSDYINANFISGPNDEKKAYIATQAPLECTVADFWRMVWEQQGRIIVMLTDMDERGMPKGTPYCPDAEDISSIGLYGDHEVILKAKDFKQEYIASTLELKDMENNLVRKLKHFWYTSWPAHGFPEPISLVKFILDVRLQNEEKLAPLIVHCSSGTGRTGTFVAIDSGIKMFDKSHTVDILNCVYRMRLERPRAVQTKQQYDLIYKALLEYASMVVSPSTSSTSSRATGNAVTYTW